MWFRKGTPRRTSRRGGSRPGMMWHGHPFDRLRAGSARVDTWPGPVPMLLIGMATPLEATPDGHLRQRGSGNIMVKTIRDRAGKSHFPEMAPNLCGPIAFTNY